MPIATIVKILLVAVAIWALIKLATLIAVVLVSTALKVPAPLLLSLLAAICDFVPILG